METLKYKNYEGTAELDMDRNVCRGKVLFIRDLVTYESKDISRLQAEFEAAVDDYLETCEMVGKVPDVPLRGIFQVRLTPALHKQAVLRSIHDETSLNDIVSRAVEAYLSTQQQPQAVFNIYNQLTEAPPQVTVPLGMSEIQSWSVVNVPIVTH